MILYFMDRRMNGIGLASIDLPDGMTIVDDLKTEEVDTGVATFECSVPFSKDTRSLVEAATKCGNYVLRHNYDEDEVYTIIDSEVDTKKGEAYIYAEDAGLDLLNEIAGAYEAMEAHPIAWYIEHFTYDTGFEIGINEAADLSRTLSWDGESTITERLASVATQFDCELSYSFTVDGLQLTHKYINIYRERGQDSGIPLRLNYEVDKIITSSSIANLATALYPTGGTPEGAETAITLSGYSYYDDGDIYLENGYLKSREAVKKWSRYLNPTEPDQNYTGHILRTYTYDTTDQSVLCAHAVTELKKVCEMEINYEVDITSLPANVRIGDRVNVIDDAGELYVSSRILKLETSIVNHKRTATLGEYLIKDSGINQKVIDLASAFAAKAQETAKAFAAAQAAQVAASTAQASANTAASAASTAQSTANNAASAASTAQDTANNVQTNLTTNYTDTEGMTDAINLKFGQITLTVEAGTGADEGKLFVKVNDGGTGKQGTIDLTGLVKFTDLETAGSTVINGGNITTGTINANLINGGTISSSAFKSLNSTGILGLFIDSAKIEWDSTEEGMANYAKLQYSSSDGLVMMADDPIKIIGESIFLSGDIVTSSAIQFGTTSAMNVYAKFIAAANGNYYGFHADGNDNFYLHKQNSSNGVLASLFAYYSNGEMQMNANADMKLYSQGLMEFHGRQALSSRFLLIGCSDANLGLDFRPDIDNQCQIGTSSQRFYKMYSTNGVATSSDKRVKNSIEDDLSAYDAFFTALRPIKYKYNSDGAAAKYRLGFVAQEVEQALIDNGFTVNDFAGLFKDDISSSPVAGIDDDIMYGLNYAEFIALNTRMIQQQQKTIDDLSSKYAALEARVTAIERGMVL